jgi:broad specificity phosphatase PhoE
MALNLSVSSPADPMNSSRLILLSHAATEAQRRTAFPLDEPVLEHEIQKIAELNWKLPAAAQIWSAPEQRTQQTSRALGFPFALANGLRDCGYGRWRGQKMDEVQSEDQEGLLVWLSDPSAAPHGGESLQGLVSRIGNWIDEQRAVKHTVAVTHPSVIRAAVIHALQIPMHIFWRIDIAPLTMTDLRFNNNMWTLRSSGCPLQKATQEEEEKIDI